MHSDFSSGFSLDYRQSPLGEVRERRLRALLLGTRKEAVKEFLIENIGTPGQKYLQDHLLDVVLETPGMAMRNLHAMAELGIIQVMIAKENAYDPAKSRSGMILAARGLDFSSISITPRFWKKISQKISPDRWAEISAWGVGFGKPAHLFMDFPPVNRLSQLFWNNYALHADFPRARDERGATLLMHALANVVTAGIIQKATTWFSRLGGDLSVQDSSGRNLFHLLAATDVGRASLDSLPDAARAAMKSWHAAGCQVDARDTKEETPFQVAAGSFSFGLARALVEDFGANPLVLPQGSLVFPSHMFGSSATSLDLERFFKWHASACEERLRATARSPAQLSSVRRI